jgi:hypothetical protein
LWLSWGGLGACLLVAIASAAVAADGDQAPRRWLDWQPLPALPDRIGVAGPFVGTHNGALVVAGGASFAAADAADLWDVAKRFHAAASVLAPQPNAAAEYTWQTGFALDRPVAYGATASTPAGIVCVGGEDGRQVFAEAFLLTWDPAAKRLSQSPLLRLPAASTAGGAAVVGGHVYVVAGQEGLGLDSATDRIWRVLCLVLMLAGSDGGLAGAVATAASGGKLHLANFHLDATSANLALWVVTLGGLGQNFSSYTSDQAVVQRYMTTPDERRAATSIWLAAGLAAVATLLFFSLGSGLYAFYRAHPEKLDPTFTTDQIFPLFILHETFPGVAGLIVAGIFAAAQSTVSTSMNSTATTVVTDFLRPVSACRSETGYLRTARWLTFGFGLFGTLLGLVFVDPEIRSLFDSFIKVVGIFMGVLGGLFALGMLTRRASGPGALVGLVAGAAVMLALPLFSKVTGYLYPALGIATCFAVGLAASLLLPCRRRDLAGLTVFTQEASPPASGRQLTRR